MKLKKQKNKNKNKKRKHCLPQRLVSNITVILYAFVQDAYFVNRRSYAHISTSSLSHFILLLKVIDAKSLNFSILQCHFGMHNHEYTVCLCMSLCKIISHVVHYCSDKHCVECIKKQETTNCSTICSPGWSCRKNVKNKPTKNPFPLTNQWFEISIECVCWYSCHALNLVMWYELKKK